MAPAQKFVDAPFNVGSLCAQGQGVLLEPQDCIRSFWVAYRIWRQIDHLIINAGNPLCIAPSEISSRVAETHRATRGWISMASQYLR